MTSYCCVSNRDINCLTVIESILNNNNFCVILFYKTLIVKNITVLFHSFFYFTTPILLFQFPFIICTYNIENKITKKPKINQVKETNIDIITYLKIE